MRDYIETRDVKCIVLTSAGAVSGTLTLPRLHTFIDFLKHEGDFLRLADASLPRNRDTSPFFAVQKAATILISPLQAEALTEHEYTGTTTKHRVTCLTQAGTLTATIEVLAGVRLSDYLMHHEGFIPMYDCVTHFDAAHQIVTTQPLRMIFLNTNLIVGMSEEVDRADLKGKREEKLVHA